MAKIQNSKPVYDLEERTTQWCGHWILEFGIYLYFGAWNLKFFYAYKVLSHEGYKINLVRFDWQG